MFEVGWKVLYDQVCMRAAGRLAEVLAEISCGDPETQSGLDDLRAALEVHHKAGTPWCARDAMEVLSILDLPAWAALLGLIDECPVLHAGISATRGSGARSLGGADFAFISENDQIASIEQFLTSLPSALAG